MLTKTFERSQNMGWVCYQRGLLGLVSIMTYYIFRLYFFYIYILKKIMFTKTFSLFLKMTEYGMGLLSTGPTQSSFHCYCSSKKITELIID